MQTPGGGVFQAERTAIDMFKTETFGCGRYAE